MPDLVTTSTGTENTAAPASTPSSTPVTQPVATGGVTPPAAAAPLSAKAALEKAAAAASSAEVVKTTATDGKAPVDAKGQPVVAPKLDDKPETDPAWLGIPEPRRNIIVQNARKAGGEEERKRFGIADDWTPEAVQGAFQHMAALATDPVNVVADLIQEIGQTRLAGALVQALGQMGFRLEPSQPEGQPGSQPSKRELPKAALKSEDGKEAYTAQQVLDILDHYKEDILAEVHGELTPFQERFETQDEREHVLNIIQESRQETAEVMAEMRQMPHFTKDNEPKIAAILAALPQALKEKVGAVGALQIAYNRFLRDSVFPTLQQTTEQQVRDRDRTKAAATNGSVSPTTSVVQPVSKKPTNVRELARHMESLAGQ